MAELATPSAAAVGTSEPAASKSKAHAVKPEKPDDVKFKSELDKAEKEHNAAREKLAALKAKIDLATPSNKDSPAAKRQQELRAELSSIRQKQGTFKTARNTTADRRNRLQDTLKSKTTELNNARSKFSYKTADEVDGAISRLQKQVDSGTMKLVDEKKALADISSLHKQKKGFTGLDKQQKEIDDLKAQINDLRKQGDNPEEKELRERYDAIAKELDGIKGEQDSAYKSLNSLRDQRTKAHAEQQEKYAALRKLKDDYFGGLRAYREYENEAYRIRKERQRTEQMAYEATKRKKIAQEKLEAAGQPAYSDEILTAEGLIRYFDPSAVEAKDTTTPSKFAATAQRTVDESGIKGTKLVRKKDDEENYFIGGAGKKGKKGKKGGAAASGAPGAGAAAESSKFNLPLGVLEELGKINVNPPMNQGDVPAVVEKLKEKLQQWKSGQDRKTKENIAKAQAEIDRLESEAAADEDAPAAEGSKDTASKPAQKNQSAKSGAAELAQEKDGVADAAADLKKASLEDKKNGA